MSELQFYLSSPRPAIEPIETRGNAFWREDRRFFIKGIYYSPKQRDAGHIPLYRRSRIDPLTDEHLEDLCRDIPIIQELGLNTVSVGHLDPSKSHTQALETLCNAGLYVLVNILEGLQAPTPSRSPGASNVASESYAYPTEAITSTFALLNQLSDFPNILAYVVSGDYIDSKMAEVARACVRDVKCFLRQRSNGRRIPVGVSNPDLLMQRSSALRYFTAGDMLDDARVDFFAPQSWSWAGKSSFQISGWRSLVQMLEQCPVPMFLHAFGTYTSTPRIWEEIACLFSRDMTGIFSGGIAYQYFEDGVGYGIVEVVRYGMRKKKRRDFRALKEQMKIVNERKLNDICSGEVKDYENWIGEFPIVKEGTWQATSSLPAAQGLWKEVQIRVK